MWPGFIVVLIVLGPPLQLGLLRCLLGLLAGLGCRTTRPVSLPGRLGLGVGERRQQRLELAAALGNTPTGRPVRAVLLETFQGSEHQQDLVGEVTVAVIALTVPALLRCPVLAGEIGEGLHPVGQRARASFSTTPHPTRHNPFGHPIHQRDGVSPARGRLQRCVIKGMTKRDDTALFGNRFLTVPAPSETFPEEGMTATDAMRLVDVDLAMEGDPQRNLATFVTTWMEPEAQRLIAENLHRNFIDHAEYPISAEIEQRCVRMLADLFHAPGRTTGCRTQGSSEAIMLGALSLKWKWRERRQAAGLSIDRPNLIFGGDVHVVWEKFCRYFDVEPRIVPLAEDKYTIGPQDVEPHLDENTIGVVAVLGTTFTGHKDDVVGIDKLLRDVREKRDLDIPIHVDGASGAFVWPFLYPDSKWDFQLEQVRSINVSGHKYGLVYPGIGWLIFREEADLAKDLVFYENYLGKTDSTFTLNFSTGASMVLAQYYNFVRLGRQGYTYVMKMMQENARALADNLRSSGRFEVIGSDLEQLPLVAFRLAGKHAYDESDIAWQLSAERGWMVPAYTLPPNAERVKILRALVKETLSREQIDRLSQDIDDACRTLDDKGATHGVERAQIKRGTGY